MQGCSGRENRMMNLFYIFRKRTNSSSMDSSAKILKSAKMAFDALSDNVVEKIVLSRSDIGVDEVTLRKLVAVVKRANEEFSSKSLKVFEREVKATLADQPSAVKKK